MLLFAMNSSALLRRTTRKNDIVVPAYLQQSRQAIQLEIR